MMREILSGGAELHIHPKSGPNPRRQRHFRGYRMLTYRLSLGKQPNTTLHRHAIERFSSSSKAVLYSGPAPNFSPITIGVRRCSALRFRFFEAEEVKVAAGVAGDDELENIGKCAAMGRAIAGEGGSIIPVSRSHTFTVLSKDAETARCPSGVTAPALTL
jgi:hypothetical protein